MLNSHNYRAVAKKLDVHYLYGRWGFVLFQSAPGSRRWFSPRLVKLDGWTFDPHEIKQALVDDGWSINIKPEKEG